MDPRSLPEASLSTARKKKRTFVIEGLVFSHSRSAIQVIRLRLQLDVSRSQMDEVVGVPVVEKHGVIAFLCRLPRLPVNVINLCDQ